MKAAIYCRVSTSQQEDGTSLETQQIRCRLAAEKMGYEVPSEFIWAEQWTAVDLERPMLDLVRQSARAGLIDALFVYTPDRLSREPVHLLMLLDEFQKSSVKLQFVEGISDATPEGQLLMHVQGYAAQRERAQIAERSMRAKEAVARSGRLPNGTNVGLYGYDYDKVRKVRTVNEKEAAAVRLMFQWASEGVSAYQITKRLQGLTIKTKKGCDWHPLGVKRILTNPAFTGVQYYGENRYRKTGNGKRSVTPRPASEVIRIEGFSPPIISQELFNAVQERLRVRQARQTKSDRKYVMTGFTRCLKCGTTVVGACLHGRYRYYRCRATVPTSIRPASCDARYIPADAFEEVAWRTLTRALRNPAVLVAELRNHFSTGGGNLGREIASLKREILDLKGQQRRLLDQRQMDYIDQDLLEAQIGPVKALCDEKERALWVLEDQQRQKDDAVEVESRIVEICKQVSEKLDSLDFDGRRATLAAFDVRVQATREELSMTIVVDPKLTTIAQTLGCCPRRTGKPSCPGAYRNSGKYAPALPGPGKGSPTPRPSRKRRSPLAWGFGPRARRTTRRGRTPAPVPPDKSPD